MRRFTMMLGCALVAFSATLATAQEQKGPAQAPVQKPVQAPVQKVAPVQKPVQAPAQKHVQAPAQKPVQSPVQKGAVQAPKMARGGLFGRIR